MYAMEITYLLWELLLHCIPMVTSAIRITFFCNHRCEIFKAIFIAGYYIKRTQYIYFLFG